MIGYRAIFNRHVTLCSAEFQSI